MSHHCNLTCFEMTLTGRRQTKHRRICYRATQMETGGTACLLWPCLFACRPSLASCRRGRWKRKGSDRSSWKQTLTRSTSRIMEVGRAQRVHVYVRLFICLFLRLACMCVRTWEETVLFRGLGFSSSSECVRMCFWCHTAQETVADMKQRFWNVFISS